MESNFIHCNESTGMSALDTSNCQSYALVHQCEKLMGVVVFAKIQGHVKFESPRTQRVHGLSDL